MTFTSLTYALFLPTVVALHRRLGDRARRWLLLVASYLFYGAWDWRFLGLLWFSTTVDFVVGAQLERRHDPRARRLLLGASLAANLGVLGLFKYAGFFVESAAGLLQRVGLEPNAPVLEVILPVGISFYTFQTISYSVDVYRGRLAAERDPVTFALYVAYFPQLVAGPIERAVHLLPQLRSHRRNPDLPDATAAVALILLGVAKKVVVADTLAPVVERGFGGAGSVGAVPAALAVVAFTLQVYGDFSGYTDIARGTSRLFGIELIPNFAQPFLSRSITELWRRWHMSLYGWLREYVYIPLGGNRGGRWRTYRNLLATMTLGGLWHGAAWTFVLWGLLHGVLLAGERAAGVRPPETEALPRLREVPAVVATFTAFALSLVLFRADSLTQAGGVVSSLLTGRWAVDVTTATHLALVAAAAGLVLLVDVLQRLRPSFVRDPLAAPVMTGALAGGVVVLAVAVSGGGAPPFIYFQF